MAAAAGDPQRGCGSSSGKSVSESTQSKHIFISFHFVHPVAGQFLIVHKVWNGTRKSFRFVRSVFLFVFRSYFFLSFFFSICYLFIVSRLQVSSSMYQGFDFAIVLALALASELGLAAMT